MSATPTSSSTMFLFFSSACASASGVPPVPSWPNWSGSIGLRAAGASGGEGAAAAGGGGRLGGLGRGGRGASRAARSPPRGGAGSGRGTARRGVRRRRSTRRTGSGRRSACRRDALRLDLLGVVEEPVDLLLGIVGVAGVVAVVPDAHAHLEEADRVGVAEVEVLQARLDQRRHDRELRRQPALLGLLGHPRRELRLRRVVARVGAAHPGEVDGRRGGIGRGAAAAGAAGAGSLLGPHGLQEQVGVAARLRRSGRRRAGDARDLPGLRDGREEPGRLLRVGGRRRLGRRGGRRRDRRARRRSGAAGATAAATGAACAAPATRSGGSLKSGVISCLNPTWTWFWCAASVK